MHGVYSSNTLRVYLSNASWGSISIDVRCYSSIFTPSVVPILCISSSYRTSVNRQITKYNCILHAEDEYEIMKWNHIHWLSYHNHIFRRFVLTSLHGYLQNGERKGITSISTYRTKPAAAARLYFAACANVVIWCWGDLHVHLTNVSLFWHGPLTRYVKSGCACAGNSGNVF